MFEKITIGIVAIAGHAAAQVNLEIVAYEGPPPPGFKSGVYFNAFPSAAQTTDGIAVFRSILGGEGINGDNAPTVWTNEAGLVLVVQGGDEAPGTDGMTFKGMLFSICTGPDILVYGTLEENNYDGVWRRNGAELEFVILEHDEAPGFDPPQHFQSISKPIINAAGDMYFRSAVKPIFGGVEIDVVYSDEGGELLPIIKEGDDVGFGPLLGPIIPRFVNDAGDVIIDASVEPGEDAVWIYAGGALELILMAGDFAPGEDEFPVEDAAVSALNASGHYALTAGIEEPGGYAISFANRGDSLEPLFAHLAPAPMTEEGTTFNTATGGVQLNDLDEVIFATTLNGPNIPGEANYAQWYDDGGEEPTLIVRRDDPLPGAPAGTLIDASGYIDLNNKGDIILLTTLYGDPVDFTTNKVLLSLSLEGDHTQILREGDEIEMAFEDVRTLSDFEIAGRLTDQRRVLVLAEFLDGTEALLSLTFGDQGCPADFNNDGLLNILDFVAFQNAFVAQDPKADCDGNGQHQILDFLCFQIQFVTGCD